MAKFDKKAFKKNNNKLFLAIGCVGLLGVASLICGFACGRGVDLNFRQTGKDPGNYYGTYYGVADGSIYWKYEISADKIKCTYGTGLEHLGDEYVVEEHNYDYVTAENVGKYVTPYYQNKDAIFIYTDSNEDKAMLLYVMSNDPGDYVFQRKDESAKITTEVKSYEIDNGIDKKDYFGKYKSSLYNVWLILDEDYRYEYNIENNITEFGRFTCVSRKYALGKMDDPNIVPPEDRIILCKQDYSESYKLMGFTNEGINFPVRIGGKETTIYLSRTTSY